MNNIFILAEAKHNITNNKIATKLWQFDKIRTLFECVKRAMRGEEGPFTQKFITTVRRNQWLAAPTDYVLMFGAASWGKDIMRDLQQDVVKRASLNKQFRIVTGDKKKELYAKIRDIDQKWYKNADYPERHAVSDESNPAEVDESMKYVNVIHASGDWHT